VFTAFYEAFAFLLMTFNGDCSNNQDQKRYHADDYPTQKRQGFL